MKDGSRIQRENSRLANEIEKLRLELEEATQFVEVEPKKEPMPQAVRTQQTQKKVKPQFLEDWCPALDVHVKDVDLRKITWKEAEICMNCRVQSCKIPRPKAS